MRAYACAPAFADLMKIKGLAKPDTDLMQMTPNPVSAQEAQRLIETIKQAIAAGGRASEEREGEVPCWLEGSEVVAISGINGLCRLASDVLDGQIVFTPEGGLGYCALRGVVFAASGAQR
jgi:hypothetical protein